MIDTPLTLIPSGERYVEVALPVPLRRRFTYLVPERAPDVPIGARVAVPFGKRKLVGVVVGVTHERPEGVRAMKRVAGLVDPEPAFNDELLGFLLAASDYYLHPVGEVLRAAGPTIDSRALKRLRADGFLADGESLPGKRAKVRRVTFARRTTTPADVRLGSRQKSVLALLEERDEVSIDELRLHVSDPRAVLRALTQRDLISIEEREIASDPFFSEPVVPERKKEPTAAQRFAIDRLVTALGAGPSTHLLHGVTGSGKTEVYLQVIHEARERGMGALLLVPEIALTPQLVTRFRARFGDRIAVLHSGLTDKERYAAWRGLRRGELTLAIGARSALFAPVERLGVIVVDEEHDGSFKQEEGFRYHARDMAILRAHRAGAICILGSATPSLESFHHARDQKRYQLLSLPDRATSRSLPEVEVVDLKQHGPGPSGHPLITGPLHRALETCLAGGHQAIIFLNRRGFSPSARCNACGEVAECPACSVSLTEHRRAGLLRCHYCDFSMAMTSRCPTCHREDLVPLGVGTERLEDALRTAFEPARVARLDRDTAAGGRAIESVLQRLRDREIDVLVGTQMVTKGHDIPGVTLVGVVLADQSLAFPDFRASERTFQLLSQVAGRAGRGTAEGRVVLQTFQPNHPAVQCAKAHDYEAFYRAEIENRRELQYAPFGRLCAVRIDAADERRAKETAERLTDAARAHPAVRSRHVMLLGPTPAPIARIRGRFRYRLMLRGAERGPVRAVAHRLVEVIHEGLGAAHAHVDVDPVSML